MGNFASYVVGVLGLALLMIVHECGHYFVARAYGMRVNKFSIGFGPTFFKIQPKDGYFWFTTAAERVRLRLWKHDPERHGPTVYQVAMIPFLAYVQIAGMNPLEDIEPNDKGSYANARLTARIATIFAGPAANYLFASVFFFASFIVGGKMVPLQDDSGSTVVTVVPGGAAEAAGLKSGDRIVEVGQHPVDKWTEMAEGISKHPDETIPVVVERGGERLTLSVTPRRVDPPAGNKKAVPRGRIGVMLESHHVDVSTREAALLALKEPPQVVKRVVIGIGQLISREVDAELSGPVGMVNEAAKVLRSQHPFVDFMFLLGVVSAYLGAFNLIPFPALDGGRLMFLGYEATTRRRPDERVEMHVHFVGLVMMLGLTLYVTVTRDLKHTDDPPAPSATPAATMMPTAPMPASTGSAAPPR